MKKLISLFGTVILAAPVITPTINNIYKNNENIINSELNVSKKNFIESNKIMAFSFRTEQEQEKQRWNILDSLAQINSGLVIVEDKLDKTLFNDVELKCLRNLQIPSKNREQFLKDINPISKIPYKTHKYNCGNGFKIAVVTHWYTWISGYWHLDFNHKFSQEIANNSLTAGEIAATIGAGLSALPIIGTAIGALAILLLASSLIFKNSDHGNGVWVGMIFALPFVGGVGSCEVSW